MTGDGFPTGAQPSGEGGWWTTIGGSVDKLISGGIFNAPVFMGTERDLLPTVPIEPRELDRYITTFFEHPQFAEARATLERESAVALLGPKGCGRRTTGTVLLASLGVVPERVVLDAEDLERQLEIAAGHGYLLDLDEDADELTAKAGVWIARLVAQLRAMNSYLVVRASDDSWRSLSLGDAVHVTPLAAPGAISVFRTHLAAMTSVPVAEDWAQREQIDRCLAAAAPQEGVRMAQITAKTSTLQIPDEQKVSQVIAEYTNWKDQLAEWFRKSTGPECGYQRALLLAVAALEGAPAATVFAAADALAKIVELPRQPGGALAGPDANELVGQAEAQLKHDASIDFARPAYGNSVLDHVWSQRPQLHADMREWLIRTAVAADEGSGLAARALTGLAIRQREPDLVYVAARKWAQEDASRHELAIPELTTAALSDEIGRDVRRKLYDWAGKSNTGEATLLAVVGVCAGPLARLYPQIALTRLRNLVVRPIPNVQEELFNSLTTLVREPALYPSVVAEVARWVSEKNPRRSAGLRAFLRLATPGELGQIAILARATQRDRGLLGDLWHEALRDEGTDGVAGAAAVLASAWLDVAALGQVPWELVLDTLAGSCRSSVDVGLLAGIAFAGVGSRDSNPARWDIGTELVRRTWERDPILASPAPASTTERS
jgi:hypothetical protein